MDLMSIFVMTDESFLVALQISFLFGLVTLTVFRKQLSTNDEYRTPLAKDLALEESEAIGDDQELLRSGDSLSSEAHPTGEHHREHDGGDASAVAEVVGSESNETASMPMSRIQTMLGTNTFRESITRSFGQVPELSEKGSKFLASLMQATTYSYNFKSLYRLSRRRDSNRNEILFSEKDGTTVPTLVNAPNMSLDSLSTVVLGNVVQYLTLDSISALGNCNLALAKDTRSDVIWRSLWIQNYGQMWNDPQIASIRRARGISWNPCPQIKHSAERHDAMPLSMPAAEHGGERSESSSNNSRNRKSNSISLTPRQGWFMFFMEFDACWVDWLLAGFCTSERCLIGLGGSIYDITRFLPLHPGSLETLTEVCGGDGSDHFVDIGHSSHAVSLANEFLIYSPYDANTASSGANPAFAKSGDGFSQTAGGGPSSSAKGRGSSSSSFSIAGTTSRTTHGPSSHLLSRRHRHAINSHRRQMQTYFHQQIRREQRAVERNASRWNLQRTEAEKGTDRDRNRNRNRDKSERKAQKDDDRGRFGARTATLSEDLQTALGLGDPSLPGPIIPPSDPLLSDYTPHHLPQAQAQAQAQAGGGYGFHGSSALCGKGLAPHYGRARAIFDPLQQSYMVWWTCCCCYTCSDSGDGARSGMSITK